MVLLHWSSPHDARAHRCLQHAGMDPEERQKFTIQASSAPPWTHARTSASKLA